MNQARALQTLQGLVGTYSPSGSEQAAVDYLVGRMHELGYAQAYADAAGNAVGVIGQGSKTLMLLGHIDTVPGEIPVRIEDGVLYGRGSVDAKSPLAAFTEAAAGFTSDTWRVMVIGAVGEEADSPGAKYVRDHYHADAVIIGEPSQWQRFTLGYKGSAWMNLHFEQAMAHTASQQISACELAFQTWAGMQLFATEFNAGKEKAFEQLQLTLRGFNSTSDGFIETASLTLGSRLPLSLPPTQWLQILQNINVAMRIETLGEPLPAYQADKNSFLARLFLRSIRAAGEKPGYVYKTGTADFNLIGPAWNVPILAYGPGDSALDHTPNEHILLSDYYHAVQVLQGVCAYLNES
jgi:[amino group carrier protein]-lysine/ornithine hydrolase